MEVWRDESDERFVHGIPRRFLGVALFCYFLYRQCARRPVTRRDFLIPAVGTLYLGTRYLGGPNLPLRDVAIVLTATLIGVGTGLLSGQIIRVWRDRREWRRLSVRRLAVCGGVSRPAARAGRDAGRRCSGGT